MKFNIEIQYVTHNSKVFSSSSNPRSNKIEIESTRLDVQGPKMVTKQQLMKRNSYFLFTHSKCITTIAFTF